MGLHIEVFRENVFASSAGVTVWSDFSCYTPKLTVKFATMEAT